MDFIVSSIIYGIISGIIVELLFRFVDKKTQK